MQPLPTPEEMSRWDRAAIACGIPEYTLMENAAREAWHVLHQLIGCLRGKRVLLFMGSGNNGGDAACLARHLHDEGADVLVLHTRPFKAYKGITGRHLRLARACGVRFAPASAWATYICPTGYYPDIVVDGLLGTGFTGTLRSRELELVQAINSLSAHAFIFSLDIPSGLSGFTGLPCPEAVRANATVTFEAAKLGLAFPEASFFSGSLHVRPIGIPKFVRATSPASFQLIGEDLSTYLPRASFDWHKGLAGSVLIIGGSKGLEGAPHLAAQAALRTGAGLVSIAAPAGLCRDIKASCPDIMMRPLGEGTTDSWSPALLSDLQPLLSTSDAVVLGPGLGRGAQVKAFVRAYLAAQRPQTVLDADALQALAADAAVRGYLKASDVLTPHPGEAAALLGISAIQVQRDRVAALTALQNYADSVWVLKGAGTLVGTCGKPIAVSPFAVPSLAVGGAGDVLAGCLGALLALLRQKADPLLAACLAVFVHARAGLHLEDCFPARGNAASEIADALPAALASMYTNSSAGQDYLCDPVPSDSPGAGYRGNSKICLIKSRVLPS